MIFSDFNERIHIFLTSIIAFLLPAYPVIVAPVFVLLTINSLFVPKLMIQGFKNSIKNPGLLLMVLLYALYLLGMLYSDNLKFGYETIETKLSFLIFPLVFSPYTETCKKNLNKYLKLFIYGCIFNALVCFIWATYCFFKPVYVVLYGIPYNLGVNYFYYAQLSVFLHPGYIAMYSVFALMALFYLINAGELKLNWKWYASIVLLVIFILLLSSKAGWIGLLLFVLYFFRWLIIKKRIIQASLIVGLLIVLFSFFNIYYTPQFSNRIPKLSVITEALKESNGKTTTSNDGTGRRILVWKAATEIIKNNFWIGVGTGDAKDKMLEKYKEKGMVSEYEYKLNSHNQFLQTGVALGLIGLLVLTASLLLPLYKSFKERKMLYFFFLILIIINFLFESMLETQAGVVFYAFFNSLLFYSKPTNSA